MMAGKQDVVERWVASTISSTVLPHERIPLAGWLSISLGSAQVQSQWNGPLLSSAFAGSHSAGLRSGSLAQRRQLMKITTIAWIWPRTCSRFTTST